MADGVHFGEHTCVVALGMCNIDGVKHPLALEEGSTENATLVTDLITGLRDRGLDVTKPILAVIDGSKALSRAIKDVFDKPLIHRCQQHKIRECKGQAPRESWRTVAEKRMRGGLSRRFSGRGGGPAYGPGPRAGPHSSRRRRVAARGHGRDADHPAPRRAAHPGPHAALHEPDRIHDRDLQGAFQERQAVARRANGPALVRRRNARAGPPVPAASTAACTCRNSAPRWKRTSTEMSPPPVMMRTVNAA